MIPLCIVVINFMLFTLWGGPTILRDIIRIGAVFAGGWLIVKEEDGNLLRAALAGPFLILVDHVLLAGGHALLFHLIDPAKFGYQGLRAFGGVMVSYVMFFWVSLLIAFLGGMVGKHM